MLAIDNIEFPGTFVHCVRRLVLCSPQTNSLPQITRALRALVDDHMDEVIDYNDKEEARSSEETDALEVRYLSIPACIFTHHFFSGLHRPLASLLLLSKVKVPNGCFPDVQEARLAIEQVVIPKGESVQLLPRPSSIISSQVGLVESFSLKWEVVGQEPKACVRILPHFAPKQVEAVARETPAEPADSDWESHDDSDHTQSGITRLPFLPD